MKGNYKQSGAEELANSIGSKAERLSARAGALIYSKEQSPDQYLLLLSGSVRLIDPNRTFGSLTAGTLDSPQIFGIEQLLCRKPSIEVRCTTECTFILLDAKTTYKERIEAYLRGRITRGAKASNAPLLITRSIICWKSNGVASANN